MSDSASQSLRLLICTAGMHTNSAGSEGEMRSGEHSTVGVSESPYIVGGVIEEVQAPGLESQGRPPGAHLSGLVGGLHSGST